MQKILISGYTGFIGSNLTRELTDKILFGVDIIEETSVSKHFQWDSLDECTDENIIIHLAGKAHDTRNSCTDQEYYDINVGLTQKLFQHFLRSSAVKFIFFSSVKAVTDTVEGDKLTEDAFPSPKTSYGRSKFEAEKYILTEWAKWKKEELSSGKDNECKKVFILRPCMIHGPGNKGNLNLLYKLQQKNFPWPLGAFNNRRSFCSLANLIFIIRHIIETNIEPGIYHVADDEALSTNELIKLIALSQHKKVRIWNIPVYLVKIVARFGDLFHLPLNTERLRKLTESYIVSNQKLKDALGIEKMPLTATEGLKETLKSFN